MATASPLPPGLTLSIPGQGDYLQSMSSAQSAYEKAVAKLQAQRRQQQYLAGLNDQWQVDPNQQYGSYQQMLQNEGLGLMQAQEGSQQRGLFGGGLANQGESLLHYGQAAEQLGFRNQLSDWENQYQQGLAQAEQDKAAANLAAQQAAAQQAAANQQFTPYTSGDISGGGGTSEPPIPMWQPPIPTRPVQQTKPVTITPAMVNQAKAIWSAPPSVQTASRPTTSVSVNRNVNPEMPNMPPPSGQVYTAPAAQNIFNPYQKKAPVTRVRATTTGGYYSGGGRI